MRPDRFGGSETHRRQSSDEYPTPGRSSLSMPPKPTRTERRQPATGGLPPPPTHFGRVHRADRRLVAGGDGVLRVPGGDLGLALRQRGDVGGERGRGRAGPAPRSPRSRTPAAAAARRTRSAEAHRARAPSASSPPDPSRRSRRCSRATACGPGRCPPWPAAATASPGRTPRSRNAHSARSSVSGSLTSFSYCSSNQVVSGIERFSARPRSIALTQCTTPAERAALPPWHPLQRRDAAPSVTNEMDELRVGEQAQDRGRVLQVRRALVAPALACRSRRRTRASRSRTRTRASVGPRRSP